MRFSGLNNRVLILVSIPLVAGISFVSVLMFLVNSLTSKSDALELSRLRIAQAGRLSTAVYELSKSALVQSYPMSDYIARPFAESRRQVIEEKKNLVLLLKEQPGETTKSRVRELDSKVNELVAEMDELSVKQFAPNTQGAITEMGMIAAKTDPVVDLANEIIEAERRIEASKQDLVKEQRQALVGFTLIAGLSGTVMVTLLLAGTLSEGFVRRIKVMKQNTRMLAEKKGLAPIDRSEDELGELDRAFHQLAEELARLESRERATIQLASDMIVGFDRDLSIQFCNPSFAQRFAQPGSAAHNDTGLGATANSILDCLREEARDRFVELVAKHATAGGAFTLDLSMKSGSGQSLLSSCSASWSPQDELFYCVLHDVTERRLLEDYRANLLLMVGHDLRTPLSTLILALEKVQEGEQELSSLEAGRLLTAAHYLRNLAESLLTAEQAQLGQMRLTLKPSSVTTLIDEAILILRLQAENKLIELRRKDDDLQIVSDKQKCVQVLVNLMENAIKYSEKGAQVLINAFESKGHTSDSKNSTNDSFARIEVVSSGAPLNEENISSLFQPFARGEDDKQKAPGYGLGLATAAQIVKAHGGEIGAENLDNSSGAIFWFTLPLCQFEEE